MIENNRFSTFLIEKNKMVRKLISETSKFGGIDEDAARYCNQNAMRSLEDAKELNSMKFDSQTIVERWINYKQVVKNVKACLDPLISDKKQHESIANMTDTTYKMVFSA